MLHLPTCTKHTEVAMRMRSSSTFGHSNQLSPQLTQAPARIDQARLLHARPRKRTHVAVRSEAAAQDLERPHSPIEFRAPPVRSRSPNLKITGTLPITSYHGLLSSAGKARNPGGLNTVLESYSEQPADDRIPLHGGLPHPDAFPFTELTVKLKSGETLTIDNQEMVKMHLLQCVLALTAAIYAIAHTICSAAGDRCTAVCNSFVGEYASLFMSHALLSLLVDLLASCSTFSLTYYGRTCISATIPVSQSI